MSFHKLSIMLAYFLPHVRHAAITQFDFVSVEDGVQVGPLRKMGIQKSYVLCWF